MFENIFKKLYKSKKTVSKEEKEMLEKELAELKQDTQTRKQQIEKFNKLIQEDPDYKQKYIERKSVHEQILANAQQRIEKIEIILLDS